MASLTSTNQIDKDALSQVLDQIHSTASQTDTLTTFNEFAPPPSSSASDSRGIANDLQGGISGLYNRFRASVGNVIDPSNVGGEGDAADRLSTRSLTRSSPAPSIRGSATPTKTVDQSVASATDHSRAASGRQSLLTNTSDSNYTIGPEDNDGQGRYKLKPAKYAAGQDPQTTQVGGNNQTSYAGKDDIIDSRDGRKHPGAASSTSATASRSASIQDRGPPRPETPSEMPKVLIREDTSSTKPSVRHPPGQAKIHGAMGDKHVWGEADQDPHGSARRIQSPGPDIRRIETPRSANPPPINEVDLGAAVRKTQDVLVEKLSAPSSKPAVEPEAMKDEHVDSSNSMSANGGQGAFQKLGDLAARKSIAPPLVSHGASPQSRLSRASSADTTTDGTRTPQRPPHPINDSRKEWQEPQLISHVRPLQRNPRTMNVFSQSRNKVLSKEYWMKDEGARECFNCGEAFSTFRRKHHCRKHK